MQFTYSFRKSLVSAYIEKSKIGFDQSTLDGFLGKKKEISYAIPGDTKTKNGMRTIGYINDSSNNNYQRRVFNTDGIGPTLLANGTPINILTDKAPSDINGSEYMGFGSDHKSPQLRNKYIRDLTGLERARLQGIPDDTYHKWKVAGISDAQINKFIGDSIAVPVMSGVFKELVNQGFIDDGKEKPIRINELFGGIGTQAMALRHAGIPYISTISEIDDNKIKAYELANGKVMNLGDINKINTLPQSDVVTISSPCTNISNMGKQEGLTNGSGTDSSLLWRARDLLMKAPLDERPKVIIFENVKNILAPKYKRDLDEWRRNMSEMGYTSTPMTLNAHDFGLPQNRERYIMVSVLGNRTFTQPKYSGTYTKLSDILEDDVPMKRYLAQRLYGKFGLRNQRN